MYNIGFLQIINLSKNTGNVYIKWVTEKFIAVYNFLEIRTKPYKGWIHRNANFTDLQV